jgi:hypothetical protein
MLGSIRKGAKCLNCRLLTTEQVTNELAEYGLTLISYINTNMPIVYECVCGGIGKTLLCHIRNNSRCGHCIEMQWRDYFLTYGCEIVNYTSYKNITYRCSCGEIRTTTTHLFKIGGKKCSKCRTYWSKPNKIPNRKKLYLWKKAVVIRDGFNCQICATELVLCVHHIEAYSVKPDLAADVDNGITLCYDCHRNLHTKYGIQVGRVNLLKELGDENSAA